MSGWGSEDEEYVPRSRLPQQLEPFVQIFSPLEGVPYKLLQQVREGAGKFRGLRNENVVKGY